MIGDGIMQVVFLEGRLYLRWAMRGWPEPFPPWWCFPCTDLP